VTLPIPLPTDLDNYADPQMTLCYPASWNKLIIAGLKPLLRSSTFEGADADLEEMNISANTFLGDISDGCAQAGPPDWGLQQEGFPDSDCAFWNNNELWAVGNTNLGLANAYGFQKTIPHCGVSFYLELAGFEVSTGDPAGGNVTHIHLKAVGTVIGMVWQVYTIDCSGALHINTFAGDPVTIEDIEVKNLMVVAPEKFCGTIATYGNALCLAV